MRDVPTPVEPGRADQTVTRNVGGLLMVSAMIAVIVSMDVLLFRHEFWPRLAANVGIVLLFVAFYSRFVRHS